MRDFSTLRRGTLMATPKWNKERKLWIIQGKRNGLRKVFYSSTPGMKGKREVLDKYDDWVEFGGTDKITVEKCVELYLADIEARLGRRDTYRKTEIYTRLYVLPALGKCKMNNLTLRDGQSVLNDARAVRDPSAPLSYKTMTHLRTICVGLHKLAYSNYYCDDWRGSLYIPKGHQKGERQILQPADIAALFAPCSLWYVNAFRVMLLCGLRPGEAYGLQEQDIGAGGILYIRRAVNDEGEITEGKNKNAKRIIPLPPLAAQIIEETIQRNHEANFGTPWVFCNYYGGKANQGTARKQWDRLKAERGLPGSPYSLRHTFVSIVSSQTTLAEGTIKDIVGHSDTMDTFGTYKHTVSGELEQAAKVINLTFERLKEGQN